MSDGIFNLMDAIAVHICDGGISLQTVVGRSLTFESLVLDCISHSV